MPKSFLGSKSWSRSSATEPIVLTVAASFPMAMAAWKISPALACGNTVVLKPAEQTPLSILFFANLVKEAGFPPGVVNILNGHGSDAGAALASHLEVDKIAFTGSTATARQVMRAASVNLKNITLETGGKSPLLVFEDADLEQVRLSASDTPWTQFEADEPEQAVRWSHMGIMANAGQICTATSRILVQEPIYETFVQAFKERIRSTSVVGDPFEEGTYQGPQVTKAQYERVLGYIETGTSLRSPTLPPFASPRTLVSAPRQRGVTYRQASPRARRSPTAASRTRIPRARATSSRRPSSRT